MAQVGAPPEPEFTLDEDQLVEEAQRELGIKRRARHEDLYKQVMTPVAVPLIGLRCVTKPSCVCYRTVFMLVCVELSVST